MKLMNAYIAIAESEPALLERDIMFLCIQKLIKTELKCLQASLEITTN
jgi:hypothetical protein